MERSPCSRVVLTVAVLALLMIGARLTAGRQPSPTVKVAVRKDVAYFTGDGVDERRHKLDLYLPEGKKEFPLLLFVHGGAWRSGSKDLYPRLGETFATKGIGVAVANYRLSPAVQHPEHVRDVARSFSWVCRNAKDLGADPKRLYLSGHSAGAHLVALLVLDPRYLKAEGLTPADARGVIAISGPFTLVDRLFPEVFGEDERKRQEAFPLTYARDQPGEKLPRFLLLYAERDYPGLPLSSQALHAALQQLKAKSALHEIKDRDHISIIVRVPQPDDETARRILEFIGAG